MGNRNDFLLIKILVSRIRFSKSKKMIQNSGLLQHRDFFLFDPATKTFSGYHHQEGNVNSLSSDTVFTVKKTDDNQLLFGTFDGLDLMDIKTGIFRHFQNNPKDTESIR